MVVILLLIENGTILHPMRRIFMNEDGYVIATNIVTAPSLGHEGVDFNVAPTVATCTARPGLISCLGLRCGGRLGT